MYFKLLHWIGQTVCFMLELVYMQCKSPLLPIGQEAGWVAEPVQLLWREEKKNLFPHTPEME